MQQAFPVGAADLARAIAAGEIGSRQALDVFLERIERRNPAINAVVVQDIEGARARADAADAARAAGQSWGPLHGVPMTVKDTWEVAGMVTACGDPGLADYRPATTAVAVQRLLDAGAIVFGKTNTPRMAQDLQTYNKVYGTTNNPWDVSRTSGGSSGGAAAAVAAGFTALELGSDIGGSIRTPAHWCGVYGHKPSYGLIPMTGHIPGPPGTRSQPDLAVGGPLARDAADLELAMDVLAGPDDLAGRAWRLSLPPARHSSLADFRIGCWFDDEFAPIDTETRRLQGTLATALEGAGAEVDASPDLPVRFPDSFLLYQQLLNAVVGAGIPPKLYRRARRAAALFRLMRRTRAGTLGGFVAEATQSHKTWAGAHERRERQRRDWAAFFERFDVLLMPVTATPAIPHNQEGNLFARRIDVDGRALPYHEMFKWIAPPTSAYLPVTVAPIGRTAAGLPVGVQIVAPYLEDRTGIAFARLLADVIGGFVAPPAS
ncbi:amidase [Spectribacter hydrogenoxidans]|uniref:Amidase n=1 Tax=Spectribacter hydrogenoxidans TaxID=3075608 RepID=A0ABU3BZ28_9GAMM|nr:amidase [Salinisphaera sp. W335]MDT0634520.1 amidase [Salinisphaera sp. W335]